MIRLTKEELKLQAKITKLEEANKKLEDKYKKSTHKLPMSASHLGLYVSLLIYTIVALTGIIVTIYFMIFYQQYVGQIIIGLFSFCTICGSTCFGFYYFKAKKEYELNSNERKLEGYINASVDITEKFTQGKVDDKGVQWCNTLRQDNSTTIQTNGFGGSTIIDSTNYLAQNPTSE